ncbi:uncharacterized protein LOC127078913 [Lathyrus oleraceus]|uniref:uncharacterized protein LOC127078913 n=1 Tax=Pisum sativum TaxID=3888 RepID=UPI0021D09AD9|nr:uncharacterized protein LOC127078913 [Pisum sativum]
MDHFAAAEEQLASQRLRKKLEEVNVAAQTQLAPVQDHVNYTLQKAYFKCAYECFDRSRRQEEISHCVGNCSIPITNVQQTFDNEMAKFQEKLNRSLMVCQDKYDGAKLQQKTGAMNVMVSCADDAIQDSIKMLPLLTNKLKTSASSQTTHTQKSRRFLRAAQACYKRQKLTRLKGWMSTNSFTWSKAVKNQCSI